jgi:hypothetical protein
MFHYVYMAVTGCNAYEHISDSIQEAYEVI